MGKKMSSLAPRGLAPTGARVSPARALAIGALAVLAFLDSGPRSYGSPYLERRGRRLVP